MSKQALKTTLFIILICAFFTGQAVAEDIKNEASKTAQASAVQGQTKKVYATPEDADKPYIKWHIEKLSQEKKSNRLSGSNAIKNTKP